MKKILLVAAIFSGLLLASPAKSQVSISVNIGSQPNWGPAGYDYASYYYLPDIDVYYNIPQRQFVYFQGNRWNSAPTLPSCYGNYDLYSGYKVVINEPRPYLRADEYRRMYAPYKYRHDQVVIRDSRGPVYGDRHDNKWGSDRNNDWDRKSNNGRGNAYGHNKKGRDDDHGKKNDRW